MVISERKAQVAKLIERRKKSERVSVGESVKE